MTQATIANPLTTPAAPDCRFSDELDGSIKAGDRRFLQACVDGDLLGTAPYLLTLLQIHGVALSDRSERLDDVVPGTRRQGDVRFREASVEICGKVVRLRLVRKEQTPFSIAGESLLVWGHGTDILVRVLPEQRRDRNAGYYFPQLEGRLSRRSLRFNPRNLGGCAGGCVFCQRAYALPTARERAGRKDWRPVELVVALEQDYGPGVFREVDHALVVTELYGSADRYLEFCEELESRMRARGFSGQFSALGQEVRTHSELTRLHAVVGGFDFCYTLECFERRDTLMSRYKGLPLEEVAAILRRAEEVGFEIVMANYVAGIDSLAEFARGIIGLKTHARLDAVGLNLFTPYTDGQDVLRCPEGMQLGYYARILTLLSQEGIGIYRPELYERSPALVWLTDSVEVD